MSTKRKHANACKSYKQSFLEEHGYGYCEICGRSDKPLTVHHIYYASRYPKHPELHNKRNLILVCTYGKDTCHEKFHAGEYQHHLERLEEERGLVELFG